MNVSLLLKAFCQIIFVILLLPAAYVAAGMDEYYIEIDYDDELFVINGEKFEAKTYCLGWQAGQIVKFISGSPYGTCLSAVLYNVNLKNTCEVWCE